MRAIHSTSHIALPLAASLAVAGTPLAVPAAQTPNLNWTVDISMRRLSLFTQTYDQETARWAIRSSLL